MRSSAITDTKALKTFSLPQNDLGKVISILYQSLHPNYIAGDQVFLCKINQTKSLYFKNSISSTAINLINYPIVQGQDKIDLFISDKGFNVVKNIML